MKTIIKRIVPVAILALGLSSCSENSWNNGLEGFEPGEQHTDVRTLSYTLTDADYSRIANNRFNKQLAIQDSINGAHDAVAALKSVASNHYLNALTPADRYIPNLLSDSLFAYFTLSDGSAINLTYKEAGELPEVMMAINRAGMYTVTDDDYKAVYGSDEDYATCFSPSYPAAGSMSGILNEAFPNAEAGEYVVVSYQESSVDPTFNTPEFEMSDVLKPGLVKGQEISVNGIVSATCTRGFVLSDKAGSILAYSGSYEAGTYKVGDCLEVKCELGAYKNCIQINLDDATVKNAGNADYDPGEATALTPDYLIAANGKTDPQLAVWGVMQGQVSISGNYMNLVFPDRSDVRGSIYYVDDKWKADLTDGAYVNIYGFFTQTSQSGDIVNANIVVANVEKATNKRGTRGTRAVTLPSVGRNAAYTFNGSSWKQAGNDIVVIQPDDYTEMGLTYGNFSDNQPAEYLPLYLSRKYPYAEKDKEVYIAYKYYSGGKTTYACAQWAFDGTAWADKIASNGVRDVTSQFVRRDGKWQMDPSIELTLPKGKGQPLSTMFFQACVDWVRANVPDGDKYITSYGNNDYYTGASAYQGNIDLRAASARLQYPEAYEGMSDDEVVALMKKRFEDQVCPGVLKELYPNIEPVGDFNPTVTIHFYTYDGVSTYEQTIVYTVVAKATFELTSCTWNN